MLNHPIIVALSKALTQTLTKQRLGQRSLYLACSGGRDSFALAQACYLLYQDQKLACLPTILHVHHGWQAVNDDWANLVQTWAQEKGFPCQVLYVKLDKLNEKSARQARYQAFLSAMNHDDVLILGHHLSDQAETVLMRLMAGAGVRGLSAMKSWQPYPKSQQKQIWLWRPWLSVSREQISQFADLHHLPYVNDATNEDEQLLRAYLRQQVLPKLTHINPKALENIARSASLCQQASMMIDDTLQNYQRVVCHDQGQLPYQQLLDTKRLKQLPCHSHLSLIHQWLGAGEPFSASLSISQQVLDLANRMDNAHQAQIFWQGEDQAFIVCAYDGLLYRYRQDAWQFLQKGPPPKMPIKYTDGYQLVCYQDLALYWQIPKHQDISIDIMPVLAQDALVIGKRHYRGKKLYQFLRLPVWLRPYLWQVHIQHQDKQESWLLSLGRAWRISEQSPILADQMPLIAWQARGDDVQ